MDKSLADRIEELAIDLDQLPAFVEILADVRGLEAAARPFYREARKVIHVTAWGDDIRIGMSVTMGELRALSAAIKGVGNA